MTGKRNQRQRSLRIESLDHRRCMAAVTNIDIKPGPSSSSPSAIELNGQFYVAADDGTHGRELFRVNPDNSLTLVADIAPGAASSNVSGLTSAGGLLYFTVDAPAFGFDFKALYRSDGTTAGTFGLLDQINSFTPPFVPMGDQLFFAANRGFQGDELYKTDGTTAGTVLVKDIDPRYEAHPYSVPYGFSSSPRYLTVFNGKLYFAASRFGQRELWKSDGTTAGTVVAVDPTGTTANSQVTAVTTYNGSLLFGATVNGLVRLHRSNGTPAGTTTIANFRSITQPTLANGSLYFVARTIASGDELWKLTGAGSPVMVKDINPNGASNPSQLTNANGRLYFTADDGVHGVELWESNGTAAGTVLVRDANPGLASSDPQILGNLNGIVYFAATDQGTTGRELWKTNGSYSGARLALDLNRGTSSSNPTQMVVNSLEALFTSTNGSTGTELRRLKPVPPVMTLPSVAPQAFTESGPVRLAPQATVTDTDTPALGGGKLFVSLGTTYRTGDQLLLLPNSTVTLSGSQVLVDGVVIGAMRTSRNSRDLTVILTPTATLARVREVIRAVAFNNTTTSPHVGSRTASFELTDGDGGIATPRSVRIDVQNVP